MKKLILLAAAVLLFITACNKGPKTIAVQSVTVTPAEITLIETFQQQLSVEILPEDATDKDCVWSSSDDAVATVSPDGKVTAVSAGLAIIKATAGGKEGTCAVTVTPFVEVTSVTVAPEKVSLKPGESADLTATVLPANASVSQVIWSSSNTAVATVTDAGHVVAVAEGEADIKAACGEIEGVCHVKVALVTAVDLGLPSGALWADRNVGAASAEAYGNYYAWGEIASKTSYSWDTYAWGPETAITKYNYEDGRCGLLAEDDAASAVFGGDWRIPTAYEWDELYNECTWNWDDTKKGYNVVGKNGNSIFLPTGGGKAADQYTQPGEYGGYWSSSRYLYGDDVAWSIGFYSDDIDYYDDYRYLGYSIRAVQAPLVRATGAVLGTLNDQGEIEPLTEYTLITGKTLELYAQVVPEDAWECGVIWSSSDATVAEVSSIGDVTAIAAGTATITITTVDGGFTASLALTVEDPAPVELPEGYIFMEDFENQADQAVPTGWTVIDADGDGYNWYTLVGNSTILGRNGSGGLLTSASYLSGVLYPDNYIFTPLIKLSEGKNYISAWLSAQDASWSAEHFGIGITATNPANLTAANVASNRQMLYEGTMTSAPANPSLPPIAVRVQGNWYQYVVEIPAAFAGQNVSICFRHFECTDMFRLNLDDVAVYTDAAASSVSAAPSSRAKLHRNSDASRRNLRTRKK